MPSFKVRKAFHHVMQQWKLSESINSWDRMPLANNLLQASRYLKVLIWQALFTSSLCLTISLIAANMQGCYNYNNIIIDIRYCVYTHASVLYTFIILAGSTFKSCPWVPYNIRVSQAWDTSANILVSSEEISIVYADNRVPSKMNIQLHHPLSYTKQQSYSSENRILWRIPALGLPHGGVSWGYAKWVHAYPKHNNGEVIAITYLMWRTHHQKDCLPDVNHGAMESMSF